MFLSQINFKKKKQLIDMNVHVYRHVIKEKPYETDVRLTEKLQKQYGKLLCIPSLTPPVILFNITVVQ